MTVRGPWYITLRALEQYLALQGLDPETCSDRDLTDAEGELIEIARLTVASGREPATTESGMLRYRGPRPERLTLIVNPVPRPEGDLPQLVGVTSPRPIRRRKP